MDIEQNYYTPPSPPTHTDVTTFASSYGKELAIAKFACKFFEQLEAVYRLNKSIRELQAAITTLSELGYEAVLSGYAVNASLVGLQRLRGDHERHLSRLENCFFLALDSVGPCHLKITSSPWDARIISGWSETSKEYMQDRYGILWDRCEHWLAVSGDSNEVVCEDNPETSILVPFYGGTDVMPLEMWRSLWQFIQDCKVTNWKEKLQEGWEKASFSGNLQAIRNRPGCGPTWLSNLTESQIKLSIRLLEHEAGEDLPVIDWPEPACSPTRDELEG